MGGKDANLLISWKLHNFPPSEPGYLKVRESMRIIFTYKEDSKSKMWNMNIEYSHLFGFIA